MKSFTMKAERSRDFHRTPARGRAAVRSGDARRDGSPLAAAMLRLQHMVGNRAVRQLIEDHGAPLDPAARHALERFFGCDLATVRIRTGPAADSLCGAVGGDAFTVGDDIVIRTDRTVPSAAAQRHFLVHEVAHVVQQRQGPVEGDPGPEGVRISEPADRFERAAELAATQIAPRSI